jgi:hypothetical protein
LRSSAPRGREGAELLKSAERDARALTREKKPYAHAFAAALSASVALERGQLDRAASLYADAARGFDGLEMGLHAAVMRKRRGEIVLGAEGGVLMEDADALMHARGVARPDRFAAMLAPLRSS